MGRLSLFKRSAIRALDLADEDPQRQATLRSLDDPEQVVQRRRVARIISRSFTTIAMARIRLVKNRGGGDF